MEERELVTWRSTRRCGRCLRDKQLELEATPPRFDTIRACERTLFTPLIVPLLLQAPDSVTTEGTYHVLKHRVPEYCAV